MNWVASLAGGPAYAAGATLLRNWKWVALALLAAWGWRVDSLRAHYKDQRDQTRAEYTLFRTEIQNRVAEEIGHQKKVARNADINHAKELADARRAGDAYKRAHRVRGKVQADPSPTAPDTNTGVPENTASDAIVVTESDFDICTVNSQYALDAHEWAISIGNEQ